MHHSFKSTPTWTLHSRTQQITKSNQGQSFPGPADYNVKKQERKVQTVATTKQKRDLYDMGKMSEERMNPGPGHYSYESLMNNGIKKSMSARFVEVVKRTPGPQEYDNDTRKVKNRAPGFSMTGRSKSYKQLGVDKNQYKPAPVAYDGFRGSFDLKTKTIFGSSQRKDLTETEKTPAPGYYQIERSDNYRSSPQYTLGSDKRKGQLYSKGEFLKPEQTPGPAGYEKKGFVEINKEKVKGFSCRERNIDLIADKISRFPGPGHYQSHLNNKNRAPRVANLYSQRRTFMDNIQDLKKDNPAPGLHKVDFVGTKYRSTSSHTFGSAKRKSLYQNQKTPAPIEYKNDKIAVMISAPGFSMGKTIPKNQFLQVYNPGNPGPGQYDPNMYLVKSKSQVFNVGKEKRPSYQKHRYSPGPGNYDLKGREEGPRWGFSREKRMAFTDEKNEAKGGNIYNIPGYATNPPKYMNVNGKLKFFKESLVSTSLSNRK